jgi:mRNA-degrading endonuclease toxin of MazEF toxin-antitoxin module
MINQGKYAEQKALAHKASTLSNVESLLTTYATSKNLTTIKKCDSLCYWLDTYIKYLSNEDDFDSKKLKSYERGDIIKANLGYNIGDEEGGLHYCAVLDNKNDLSSDIITVIPLSSYKGKAIHRKSVFLGTTLYDLMYKKINELSDNLQTKNVLLQTAINDLQTNTGSPTFQQEYEKVSKEIENIQQLQMQSTKVLREITRMNKGTIALVGQITTISKQRIYDPKTSFDVLSGIKLSPQNLDTINKKLLELYIPEKFLNNI